MENQEQTEQREEPRGNSILEPTSFTEPTFEFGFY